MDNKAGWLILGCVLIAISGCGSYTTPASIRTSSGEVLIGTTTASLSGGTFEVSDGANLRCAGTYDALDTRPTISAPVMCNDGRSGVVTVTRTPDGRSGSGTATLSDGTTATVGFGSLAASVADPAPSVSRSGTSGFPPASTPTSRNVQRTCHVGPRGGTYTITASGNKDYSGCTAAQIASLSGSIAAAQRTSRPGRTCFTGPRGGTYTITASGRKNYSGC
jgi:hypothetical protein